MIERTSRAIARRVLMVDDELAQPTSAGGRQSGRWRTSSGRADRGRRGVFLRGRPRDGGIRCRHPLRLRQLDLGRNDRESHALATDLLRALRPERKCRSS